MPRPGYKSLPALNEESHTELTELIAEMSADTNVKRLSLPQALHILADVYREWKAENSPLLPKSGKQ